MGPTRKNTLIVDFSVLPTQPKAPAVKNFLVNKIHLDWQDVRCIQLNNVRNCALIVVHNADTAARLAESHNMKHFMTEETKNYKIPVFVDAVSMKVRVHDVHPEASNEDITLKLRQFGEILTVENEIWKNHFPGFSNGVRAFRMKLVRHIPSYIVVNGEKSLVTYATQIITCKHCDEKIHFKMSCSEAKQKATANLEMQTNVFPCNSYIMEKTINKKAGTEKLKMQTKNIEHEKQGPDPNRPTTDIGITKQLERTPRKPNIEDRSCRKEDFIVVNKKKKLPSNGRKESDDDRINETEHTSADDDMQTDTTETDEMETVYEVSPKKPEHYYMNIWEKRKLGLK